MSTPTITSVPAIYVDGEKKKKKRIDDEPARYLSGFSRQMRLLSDCSEDFEKEDRFQQRVARVSRCLAWHSPPFNPSERNPRTCRRCFQSSKRQTSLVVFLFVIFEIYVVRKNAYLWRGLTTKGQGSSRFSWPEPFPFLLKAIGFRRGQKQ